MMGGFHMPDSIPLPEGFQMPDSIPAFPGGFPPMGGFPMMGGGFPMMDGFGGNAISWFAAYRVSSYDEEIATLKEWLANRLAFLDRNIERFDKDWEPRIQIPKEIKMPQFNGGFPFHNPF